MSVRNYAGDEIRKITVPVPTMLMRQLGSQFDGLSIEAPRMHNLASSVNPGFGFDAYDFPVCAGAGRIGTYSVHMRGGRVIAATYSHKGPFEVYKQVEQEDGSEKMQRVVHEYPVLIWSPDRGREDGYKDIAFI